MADLFDPDGFLVVFPAYVPVHKVTGYFNRATLLDGRKCGTIFTELDLAIQFLRWWEEQDAAQLRILKTFDDLVETLKEMQHYGLTHVIFDHDGKSAIPKIPLSIPTLFSIIEKQKQTKRTFSMKMPLQPDPLPPLGPGCGFLVDHLMVADDMWRILARNGCLSSADIEAELRRLSQLVEHTVPATLRGLERDFAVLSRDRNRVSLNLWASPTIPETIRDAVLHALRRIHKDEANIR
jgi:hypothetical protein